MIASALAPLFLFAVPAMAGPIAPAGPTPQDEAPIPPIQEEGDYYILNFSEDPKERVTLEEFVKICQEATGKNFTYNSATQNQLQQATVFMYGTKRVAKREFYRFFQILLFINDSVCIEVGPPHMSVVLIQVLQGQSRTNIKQKAVYVLPEELADYIDQPATLITTVLHLKNVEVRTLATQMRTLLTDTQTQSMVPAGEHSIILQGFGSNIASLARLLHLIDEESAEDVLPLPEFEVIPLEFASADDVADLIDQLLEARRTSVQRSARDQSPQGVSGTLSSAQSEAKILVDARTNSLLVMALAEEMPRIKELVARLDVDVIEPERNFHIYSLQNVKAEEIAEVLEDFLGDANQISRSQGGTGGRPGTQNAASSSSQNNDVVVVPDPGTNSLLIAANKTRYAEVLDLIRQLDRRQDQVLIETALIALTGSTFKDIGVELAGAEVTGDGGFGITNFGLSTIQDLDLDGIPDTRVPNLGLGFTAGILDGDDVNLPLLVAAFQQDDRANVLNVPSVLVNNNGSATVRTLDENPTTQITAGSSVSPTQTNFAGYEEAGITLQISPSISASRYLRLDINLLVSTFIGAFDPTSPIPPPRITRELITTVNVPDGDTMVIGGIITDNTTNSRTSIPWLGDLPVIGALFRRDSDRIDRTTLYFFVTPHILKDADFADLAEISYRKKLEAAEAIGRDRVQLIDKHFGEQSEGGAFEGFQVPLYRSPLRGEVDSGAVGLDPVRTEELLNDDGGQEEGASPLSPGEDG